MMKERREIKQGDGEEEEEIASKAQQPDETKSQTQRSFDNALEDLTDKSNRGRNDIIYATLGDINLDDTYHSD